MIEIRDPVHGYVKLDDFAQALISTPQMQRLRWIKQLGLANLVYPGANHTRFEHSLGAYHLAMVLADHLGLDEVEKLKVGAAALLHDVGHGPLSHATEAALSPYLRREHESVIDLLRKSELREVLGEHGLLPQEIQSTIYGENRLGQIVSSEIDADRMDYLIRDSHYTGVAYGVIDHLRLIKMMKVHLGVLVVGSGGIQAATSLLISRLLMHPAVYYHHVCRISECMISSGIRRMIDDGIEAGEIKSMDDEELFSSMISHGDIAAKMVSRIKSRRLFKRAVYVGLESLESNSRSWGDERRIAQEIADQAGLDPDYVLVDNPALPDAEEGDFPVLVDGEVKPLRDVSPLVAILEKANRANWRFGVYSRDEDRERVAQAAKKCLNLKKSPIQHTLKDIDNGYL
ncbi:MAG: HD domain-containing protein [Methanotrichaceae archaeon]|jgi:HD superfamily phosphohydrolase